MDSLAQPTPDAKSRRLASASPGPASGDQRAPGSPRLVWPPQVDVSVAIRNGEMRAFLQPIISLLSGEVAGMEVLARWDHPTAGLLEPAQFISIVEDQGAGAELAAALIGQVLVGVPATLDTWPFAFNVAAADLADLLNALCGGNAGVPESALHRIDFEITERFLPDDIVRFASLVTACAYIGIHVVMDDFGTGFSNFGQLSQVPFSGLKVDRSFINRLETCKRSRACVAAMVALAHTLGMTVTAEGVETERQADIVTAMGADFAQGFLYGRPAPMER